MYTIYKLQSQTTDKIYIGCTSKTLTTRYSSHRTAFKNHYNVPFYNELRRLKLDIDDFKIISLSRIKDRKEALQLEQTLIKMFDNVFNSQGKYISDEHRSNMSKAQKIAANKPERKARMSELKKGNKYCVGRIISQETRDKISASNMGKEGKVNSGSFKKGKEANATAFKKGNEPWNKGAVGVQKGSCVGTITVHKEDKNYRIPPDKLDGYLADGYKKGMKPRNQVKGYSFRGGKYRPYITMDGKVRNLGNYETEEEAILVRTKAMDMHSNGNSYAIIRAAL